MTYPIPTVFEWMIMYILCHLIVCLCGPHTFISFHSDEFNSFYQKINNIETFFSWKKRKIQFPIWWTCWWWFLDDDYCWMFWCEWIKKKEKNDSLDLISAVIVCVRFSFFFWFVDSQVSTSKRIEFKPKFNLCLFVFV